MKHLFDRLLGFLSLTGAKKLLEIFQFLMFLFFQYF